MSTEQVRERTPWSTRFHDLMSFMAREILVVSSPYDAFILEEDGHLEERLISAYTELSLPSVPRLTHVTNATRAMEMLARRNFDVVITVVRLEDTDAARLSYMVKEKYPSLPVLLLAFDEADLKHFPGGKPPSTIDRVFLWTGDAQILIAAIKLVEDGRNVEADTGRAGVQVIIVVEDALRRYSSFLALLYAELMMQARSLIAEGLNTLHRIMRMRARPKIVLATTYEEALSFYRRHEDNVMAVISDVRFPRDGVEDPNAGFDLIDEIRREHPDMPVLLQSAEPEVEERAKAMGVLWANKNSPTLLERIRDFLKETLGFGDFYFRLPDRTELGVAHDIYELRQQLQTVPAECVEYHASRNDFSRWLKARGMFELANSMRPRKVDEFENIEDLRSYLLGELQTGLFQEQEGVIADFAPHKGGPRRLFVRMGDGSIGGKGRGIAFVHHLLARRTFDLSFPNLEIRIPQTVVIGTEEFDRFLEENAISRDRVLDASEDELANRFLEGQLNERLLRDLELVFQDLRGPLAVRSSSLLEDSRFQPFAGIYATCMLPNNDPDPKVRFREFRQALKLVYSSTYSRDARSYFAGMPHSLEEEKMAVIIQEVVGTDYGSRFYPLMSGVAQSHNYYPVGPQRAEDGVMLMALGLGHGVTSGGKVLRVSPCHPGVLPQFATARDMLRNSQNQFFALDLSRSSFDFRAGAESNLRLAGLDEAEEDGSLAFAGSVYCAADDVIRDNLKLVGPRVVTFNNILKWNDVPVAEAIRELLKVFRQGLGTDVEIEFAVDLSSGENHGSRSTRPGTPFLAVLQVRPMAVPGYENHVVDIAIPDPKRVLCRTARALGHGRFEGVRDVVYSRCRSLDSQTTRKVAREIGEFNAGLMGKQEPYLLIGPGRWGSSDPALGIPVEWSQIAGASVIVETCLFDRPIEPSQGTHFLHNLTNLHIGYLTVAEGSHPSAEADEMLDVEWLNEMPAARETEYVRHIRLESPLEIVLDGRQGKAMILKPPSK